MRILVILCLLLCAGCSQTTLLTREDYRTSQGEFMAGHDDDALLDFPRAAEEGDFITTMERGYLSIIQGKPRLVGLRRQARLQQNSLHYHASPGAPTFFYVRTQEGYYPGSTK